MFLSCIDHEVVIWGKNCHCDTVWAEWKSQKVVAWWVYKALRAPVKTTIIDGDGDDDDDDDEYANV